MTTISGKFVGVDVSKDKLDVAVLGENKTKQVENAGAGIVELVEQMQGLDPERIAAEATGGYQRAVVEAAQKQRSSNPSPPTPSDTVLPPTSSKTATTSAPYRNSSDTKTSKPP